MSITSLENKWGSLSDSELDEWLLFQDEISDGKLDGTLLELTKCEATKKDLQDTHDLERNKNEYWLEDFPLFDEIQSLASFEEVRIPVEHKFQNSSLNLNQDKIFMCDSPTTHELQKNSLLMTNLSQCSNENLATFIPFNNNELYFDSQPFISVSPSQSQSQYWKNFQYYHGQNCLEKSNRENSSSMESTSSLEGFSDVSSGKKKMTVVNEELGNSALEFFQWDSETSRSEESSFTKSELSRETREDNKNDPEWRPEKKSIKGRKERKSVPYGKTGNQVDKKLRKKEQNKNAATRYRQKKKAEVYEILKEEGELTEKKAKLQEKLFDIQNEIKFLKGLMRDLFKAKGLIN